MALFSSMALRATQGEEPFKYLGVINDGSENQGYLEYSTEGVLSKNAKFAVEFAHDDLVHIRSCLTNKYWIRSSSSNGDWIAAQGLKPIDDQKSWMCTLFRIDMKDDKTAKIIHIQSGRTICIPQDGSVRKMFLSIDPAVITEAVSAVIDYDTLVVLPKFVAFKGSNGLFYKNFDGTPSVCDCFFGTDIGDSSIVCEILPNSDGTISVKAPFHALNGYMYWSHSGEGDDHLIEGEADRRQNPDQTFALIWVENNVIALRNLKNNKICRRGDAPNRQPNTDRLLANANSLIKDSLLEVVEPVIRRTVHAYEFDLDNARIYDVSLIYSAEFTRDNYTNERQIGQANCKIITSKSRNYSNTITVSTSVECSFKASVPFIAKGSVELSVSVSFAHQWGETVVETQEIGDIITVFLEPMTRTITRGCATRGTCDVPFSYVQKDYSMDGGPPIVTKLYDGVFTGANAYNFQDEIYYEKLPPNTHYKPPTKADESSPKLNDSFALPLHPSLDHEAHLSSSLAICKLTE